MLMRTAPAIIHEVRFMNVIPVAAFIRRPALEDSSLHAANITA